eukprot:Nk52_evm22s1705 gene=Nk52_evmTU22s1705
MSGKTELLRTEPHHVPGYGGNVANLKFQIGYTFGEVTSKLLKERNPGSRSVLSETKWNPSMTVEPVQRVRYRADGNKDYRHTQKLLNGNDGSHMVPGYTAFIPRHENYIGKRYSQASKFAVNEHEAAIDKYRMKNDRFDALVKAQSRCPRQSPSKDNTPPPPAGPDQAVITQALYRTPLKINGKPTAYRSKYQVHHQESVYKMEPGNENKKFNHGFTGFVPKMKNSVGMAYGQQTAKALSEFYYDQQKARASLTTSINPTIPRPPPARCLGKSHLTEDPPIPGYTGHMPRRGYKFGKTFGNSSKEAITEFRKIQNF